MTEAEKLSSECPSVEKLHAFSVGQLSEEEIASIGNHVGQCTRCTSVLGSMAEAPDSLVASGQSSTPLDKAGQAAQEALWTASTVAHEGRRARRGDEPRTPVVGRY